MLPGPAGAWALLAIKELLPWLVGAAAAGTSECSGVAGTGTVCDASMPPCLRGEGKISFLREPFGNGTLDNAATVNLSSALWLLACRMTPGVVRNAVPGDRLTGSRLPLPGSALSFLGPMWGEERGLSITGELLRAKRSAGGV
jgi:hypothetical protein